MPQVFYHKIYAWNLLEEAISSGIMSEPHPGSYWQSRRIQGMQEGWLNRDNRQRAREMFVFGEKILLPDEIDVPLEGPLWDGGYVNWAAKAHRDLGGLPRADVVLDEVAEFKPFILQSLRDRARPIDEVEFDEVLELWKASENYWKQIHSGSGKIRIPEGKAQGIKRGDAHQIWKLIVSLDPSEKRPNFKELGELISREFEFLRQATLVSTKGIPAFGHGPILPSPNEGKLRDYSKDTASVVGLYFQNAVRCPSPPTLQKALELKDNESIDRWKQKVSSWSERLSAGDVNWNDIKREIHDANEYIEGARFITRILPWWSLFITVPLGIVAQFIPGLAPLGWVSLGVDVISLYGKIIENATSASTRLQYDWLMISTTEPQPKK